MGTCLVSEKIQKKMKKKQGLSLGLGMTKPIDHTRAHMVSRLAEIKAEVMCCMSSRDTGRSSRQTSRIPIGQVSTDCARGGGIRPIVCVEVLRTSQQLRSCQAGQLSINPVPGHAKTY